MNPPAPASDSRVASMARGGPDAAWWDRAYEPNVPEWLDDPTVPADVKASVMSGLDRFNRRTGAYWVWARATMAALGDVMEPRVLELGAGHGALSLALARRMRSARQSARVVASDISPDHVRAMQANPVLADHGVEVREVDATAIDAEDGAYDLAVMSLTLHHLEPEQVVAAFREGTRVARRFLVIDGWRAPWMLVAAAPVLVLGNYPAFRDGVVSLRRMYSRRAVEHLARAAGVAAEVSFMAPGYLRAVLARASG